MPRKLPNGSPTWKREPLSQAAKAGQRRGRLAQSHVHRRLGAQPPDQLAGNVVAWFVAEYYRAD